jgi:hypothetical protein
MPTRRHVVCRPQFSLILAALAVLPTGCGSSDTTEPAALAAGASAAPPVDPAAAPSANVAPATSGPATGAAAPSAQATAPPAAAPAESPGPAIPAPTAEQVARWTPPRFEPLQLLAIKEWGTTSFTSRVAAAPDNKFLVAGSRVLLWAVGSDEPEHVFVDITPEDNDRDFTALAVAPNGEWFAVGDSEGLLRVFNLADRRELISKQVYQPGVQHLAISPDGAEIATIPYDNEVTVWSADKLESKATFEIPTSGVDRIEYAAPGQLAAAGETSSLWNTSTGAQIRELSPGRYNFALARSQDGSVFVSGIEDGLHVWSPAEAAPQPRTLHGVAGNERLAISPDGKLLATTNGNVVQIWTLADGRCVQVIDGFGWVTVGIAWLPGSNLLAVASDIGMTRLWGTADQGAAVQLKPLHGPIVAAPADASAPASPEQLQEVMDWRTFPAPPDFTPSSYSPTDLNGKAPLPIDELRSFYAHFLGKAGWNATTSAANPTSIEFDKDGFRVSAFFYDAGEGQTSIFLHNDGNYDLRKTPKFDVGAVEIVYDAANSASYRVKSDILTIETWLLRKLHDAGWTAYARLNSSSSEEPDKRDFEFLRNGMSLRVSIGKFPDDTNETYTIQYSLFTNDTWAPVPADAGFVEFDGSTEPELVAVTKMSPDEATTFYDRELAALGWLPRANGRARREDRQWLPFVRGQANVTVGLLKLPDNRTLVQIGDGSNSLWELSQSEVEAPPPGGLEAADLPILNESKSAKFDPVGKSIEVQIAGSTLANVAEVYTKAMGDLGWTAAEGGIRDEEYTFFDFTKDDQEITIRARKLDGIAVVNFEGDGLRWSKELPGGKQIVSYETWLRVNKLPPGLEHLDRYEAEMRPLVDRVPAATP